LTALLEQLNQKLPEDIIVHSILPVDPLVVRPARIRSLYKKYVYYIQQAHRPDLEKMKYSWYIAKRLHLNRLRQALRLLEGTHDFRPFSQSLQKQEFADMSTIRTIVHADIVLKR
jgi:tRNA pseudouridine38-40 synthase